jgi:hypothetical protein
MNRHIRAEQIARFLQEFLQDAAAPVRTCPDRSGGVVEAAEELPEANFTLSRRAGCLACDAGSCLECGYLFTGESVTIDHRLRGKLTLSDRAIHYLSHGITRYQTNYVVHGEPVVVDLDLEELAGYLDL